MRDGRQKDRARIMKETSNLPAPLVGIVVRGGGMTTVVTMKTVLLASCAEVWNEKLRTSGVVDETVDVVVDVLRF
jgi:hypothetical protein